MTAPLDPNRVPGGRTAPLGTGILPVTELGQPHEPVTEPTPPAGGTTDLNAVQNKPAPEKGTKQLVDAVNAARMTMVAGLSNLSAVNPEGTIKSVNNAGWTANAVLKTGVGVERLLDPNGDKVDGALKTASGATSLAATMADSGIAFTKQAGALHSGASMFGAAAGFYGIKYLGQDLRDLRQALTDPRLTFQERAKKAAGAVYAGGWTVMDVKNGVVTFSKALAGAVQTYGERMSGIANEASQIVEHAGLDDHGLIALARGASDRSAALMTELKGARDGARLADVGQKIINEGVNNAKAFTEIGEAVKGTELAPLAQRGASLSTRLATYASGTVSKIQGLVQEFNASPMGRFCSAVGKVVGPVLAVVGAVLSTLDALGLGTALKKAQAELAKAPPEKQAALQEEIKKLKIERAAAWVGAAASAASAGTVIAVSLGLLAAPIAAPIALAATIVGLGAFLFRNRTIREWLGKHLGGLFGRRPHHPAPTRQQTPAT
jgi:hypothetical protein